MTHQILDGANVHPRLQKMGGKTVSHGMAAGALVDTRQPHRLPHGFLHTGIDDMMAAKLIRPARIKGEPL